MRLIILSSKTGGGHEMRAQALQEFCRNLDIESVIIRPLENGSNIYLMGTHLYNWIQRFYPKLHVIYFKFLEIASLHRDAQKIAASYEFLRKVRGFSPNLVVSVHAHLNHGFLDLSKSINHKKPPKFLIYCGELDDGIGFSKHWVNPAADLFCGPTKETIGAAIQRGMPIDQCEVWGPLLRMPFYEEIDLKKMRLVCDKYKINPNLPTGLLATGANGVNSHIKALRGLANANSGIQIIALCGKSYSLYNRLKIMQKSLKFPVCPLLTIDAEEMHILLHLIEWVFGRPGAGLTSEVISSGKPMYFDISGGIMPQEQNNLNYWRSHIGEPVLFKNAFNLGSQLGNTYSPLPPRLLKNPGLISDRIKKFVLPS